MSHEGRRRRRVDSYAALLLMLFVWMFVFPTFDTGRFSSRTIGQVLFAGLLIAGVSTAAGQSGAVRWLAILAGLAVLLGLLQHLSVLEGNVLFFAAGSVRVLFLFLAMRAVFRHIMHSDSVTLDTILGAVCVFLMLTLVFAEGYRILDTVDPDAIQYVDDRLPDELPPGYSHDRYTYFSVVTITTLGYGDILPVSSAARALVQIEAILGQLYMALVLAWLVGLFMTEHVRARDHDQRGGGGSGAG